MKIFRSNVKIKNGCKHAKWILSGGKFGQGLPPMKVIFKKTAETNLNFVGFSCEKSNFCPIIFSTSVVEVRKTPLWIAPSTRAAKRFFLVVNR